MSIPLDALIDETANIYELTCAIIKRSLQLTKMGHDELEEPDAKVVSEAITQLISKTVEYRNEGI
jgi:DNA-directed RNA polymerase subunit K/omega